MKERQGFTTQIRQQIKKEQNNLCYHCGQNGFLTVHHVIGRKLGEVLGYSPDWINSKENGVALHRKCHDIYDLEVGREIDFFTKEEEGIEQVIFNKPS